MKVAYLVNQYPKVSHSFIRREIRGLESYGLEVSRFSIRSLESELVDEADQQELEKTRYLLGSKGIGLWGLLVGLLTIALTAPIPLLRALKLAARIGRRSDRGLILHFAYLAEACVVLKWARELQVAHIHAHFGTNSTTVAMLCRVLGGPSYSFTVHGPEEFDKAQAIALPEKIKRSAFVVAISSFGRSQLYRWCDHEDWARIHVVRCGVDQLFLQQSYTPLPAAPKFVCVGRISEQKGHLLLVEAAGRLAAEGYEFDLTLVGDGPMRAEVEALIEQWHVRDRIHITGWASGEAVQQYILQAQAMVLPSFAEGLPVVIMESLALGRPVLSTYVAGIPELVAPGTCGWLVPPGSVDDLVAAMRSITQTDPADLMQMGKIGMERVAQLHDVLKEAEKLAHLFEHTIKSSTAHSDSIRSYG